MSSELARVAMLQRVLAGAGASAGVKLGIGDDCAVLAPGAGELVWTIDAQIEGVHFRRDLLSLEDLGYRATMAAASDLAAMGARPVALLAGLALPAWVRDEDLEAIARGQRQAADELGTAVAGGNLAKAGELSITTTALGAAPAPLRRSGARAGDSVWLAGPVGLAGAGFAALEAGRRGRTEAVDACVAAWRRPRARIAEGLAAASVATAAIDVSDGLARDLGHVARASGVRVVLDAAAVTTPTLLQAARDIGGDALAFALHGGEDYALVVTAPKDAVMEAFVKIGHVSHVGQGADGAPGVALRGPDGDARAIEARGFDHFE